MEPSHRQGPGSTVPPWPGHKWRELERWRSTGGKEALNRVGLFRERMTIALLKALFWKLGVSTWRKSKIFDQVTITFVNCYIVGGVAFGDPLL
jgi:hypothetical protein